MPKFSFIIPVKPGGAVTALTSLRLLDPAADQFEILIAEGTLPSRQRNLAAEQARGDVLYFLDDDSRVVPDCLARCATALEDLNVAVVGGPSLTPENDSRLQRLFGAALASLFGAGSMSNRYRSIGIPRETTDQELILCNLAFRRDLFLSAGGFDERLYPNEENELLDRIAASGGKLVHIPAMGVLRSQRSSLAAFVRQMFAYGRGRAQQTLLAGPRSPISFMPLLFALYLLMLPLLPSAPLWKLPLIAYAALAIISACAAMITSGRLETALVLCVFPVMHCCNGIGLLYGFLGGKPQPPSSADVKIRRVKSFEQAAW
jgi:succinoglycan biosynthesis protein ExoA